MRTYTGGAQPLVARARAPVKKNTKQKTFHDAIWCHITEPTLLQFAVRIYPPIDWLPINDEFHSLIALQENV